LTAGALPPRLGQIGVGDKTTGFISAQCMCSEIASLLSCDVALIFRGFATCLLTVLTLALQGWRWCFYPLPSLHVYISAAPVLECLPSDSGRHPWFPPWLVAFMKAVAGFFTQW
jgi:hypothetical protein